MTKSSFSIHSEVYSPTGNLAAEGYRKLLGAPALDLLQTVVRESVQNCCDAAKLGKGPEILFRLRRLTEDQLSALKENVFRELPQPSSSERVFRDFLDQDEPWVLEICDFGTIGLAGPTRADRIPIGNDFTDFIDFLRNVGSSRDTPEGGGTYGYGKSSLYMSSRCSTILVDSQTSYMGTPVRRILGCHLGSAHELESAGHIERRTGRHWWGVQSGSDGIVDPIEGEECRQLAATIGFEQRDQSRSGTSIMILDPLLVNEGDISPEVLMGMIAETLLWYFWPRLMRDLDISKKMNVRLELNGEDFPFPEPERFPPLDIFTLAMKELRETPDSAIRISSQRPKKLLGKACIQKGIRAKRATIVPKQHSIIPEVASHIAVMRPVELVVRYYEGDPLPDRRVEWGGVFVTDRDSEIEAAFAEAEPPAHDDWQPQIMPKGARQTYVNVAVRKIREIANDIAAPKIGNNVDGEEGPSLARLSSQLGRFLDESMGQGAGSPYPGSGKGSKSRRLKRFSQPVFRKLEIIDNRSAAVFAIDIHNTAKAEILHLAALPLLVADGGALPTTGLEDGLTAVLSWTNEDGNIMGTGESINIENYSGTIELRVFTHPDAAITVKLTEAQGISEA